jgi:hypothetical protein
MKGITSKMHFEEISEPVSQGEREKEGEYKYNFK